MSPTRALGLSILQNTGLEVDGADGGVIRAGQVVGVGGGVNLLPLDWV